MNFFVFFLLKNLHMCWIFLYLCTVFGNYAHFSLFPRWEVRFSYPFGAVFMSAFYFVIFCKAGEAYAATAER